MAEIPTGVDAVVAGAGLAGHTAALAAARAGASVLLLEKEPAYGGSSVQAGGGLLFAGTPLQRAAGVDDSPEWLRADLDEAGNRKGDPVVLDAYVRTQQEAFDWLCELGASFELSGRPVPRLHAMPQAALMRLLHERVAAESGSTAP